MGWRWFGASPQYQHAAGFWMWGWLLGPQVTRHVFRRFHSYLLKGDWLCKDSSPKMQGKTHIHIYIYVCVCLFLYLFIYILYMRLFICIYNPNIRVYFWSPPGSKIHGSDVSASVSQLLLLRNPWVQRGPKCIAFRTTGTVSPFWRPLAAMWVIHPQLVWLPCNASWHSIK